MLDFKQLIAFAVGGAISGAAIGLVMKYSGSSSTTTQVFTGYLYDAAMGAGVGAGSYVVVDVFLSKLMS